MALDSYKQTASFNRGFKLTHDAILKTLILKDKLNIKRSNTGTLKSYHYKGANTEEDLSFLTKNILLRPISYCFASPIAAFVGGLDKAFGIFDGMKDNAPKETEDVFFDAQEEEEAKVSTPSSDDGRGTQQPNQTQVVGRTTGTTTAPAVATPPVQPKRVTIVTTKRIDDLPKDTKVAMYKAIYSAYDATERTDKNLWNGLLAVSHNTEGLSDEQLQQHILNSLKEEENKVLPTTGKGTGTTSTKEPETNKQKSGFLTSLANTLVLNPIGSLITAPFEMVDFLIESGNKTPELKIPVDAPGAELTRTAPASAPVKEEGTAPILTVTADLETADLETADPATKSKKKNL